MAVRNFRHNAPLDHFVGDLTTRPLGNRSPRFLGSFAGEGNDLAALLCRDLDGPTSAGDVAQALFQGEVGERDGREGEPADAPAADGIDIKVEEAGDLGIVSAISSGVDDAGPEGKLLRERMAPQQGIELLANIGRKLHRWRFWTSHSDNSQF